MSNRKQRRSLLGLVVVAALGLMAFASSAQALTPLFYVGGVPAPAGLNAPVTGKQLGEGKLLVAALNIEIRCEKFSVQEGVLLDNKLGHGKLLYENCTVWDHTKGTQITSCEIVTNHELLNSKKHITASALFLPAETTAGAPAILVEKIEAKVLTHQELGCVLPTTTVIKGELCLKINNNHAVELEGESSAAIQASCKERPALESLSEGAGVKDKLLFGINEAFVIAKADLTLTGVPHLGKTIGVLLD